MFLKINGWCWHGELGGGGLTAFMPSFCGFSRASSWPLCSKGCQTSGILGLSYRGSSNLCNILFLQWILDEHNACRQKKQWKLHKGSDKETMEMENPLTISSISERKPVNWIPNSREPFEWECLQHPSQKHHSPLQMASEGWAQVSPVTCFLVFILCIIPKEFFSDLDEGVVIEPPLQVRGRY